MVKFTAIKDWLLSAEGMVSVLSKGLFLFALFLVYISGNKLKEEEQFEIPPFEKLAQLTNGKGGRGSKTLADYQPIIDRNIFGEDSSAKIEEPLKKTDKQPLKLRLVGTQAVGVEKPFAIIEDAIKNQQEVFELNDKVFEAAVLSKIMAQRVELKYDGSIITLTLEDNSSAPASTNKEGSTSNDQTEFNVDKAELDTELENLPRLLSQARAVPYFRNGQSIGMRLFAIRSDSLYAKLGLKNGDIITNINDQSLSDPSQALKLFNTLKEEKSIYLTVERGGEQLDLKYSIN
ncbi:MAG: PDZ domain-containing protein [Deltaproteobacteria bacterium]|nr:PDZ domain-containing protein [Deltaproteobacteria bacterium]